MLAVPRSMPIFMRACCVLRGWAWGDRKYTEAPEAAGALASGRASGSGVDAGDPGAERDELRLDRLVAAVHVLHAGDDARVAGRQRGEDQRGAGAQVGDLHLAAVERRRAGDAGPPLVERLDDGAHLHQLPGVIEPGRRDRLRGW